MLGITLLLVTTNTIQCKRLPLRRRPIGEAIFDVTKFGAKGNGIEDDTMVRFLINFDVDDVINVIVLKFCYVFGVSCAFCDDERRIIDG